MPVVRAYEAFLQEKERERLRDAEPGAGAAVTDGRQAGADSRTSSCTTAPATRAPSSRRGRPSPSTSCFETEDPSLAFHVRVGVDREDGVQAFAVDTRARAVGAADRQAAVPAARSTFPELPIAQGEFRVFVYLGDEKALHVTTCGS